MGNTVHIHKVKATQEEYTALVMGLRRSLIRRDRNIRVADGVEIHEFQGNRPSGRKMLRLVTHTEGIRGTDLVVFDSDMRSPLDNAITSS